MGGIFSHEPLPAIQQPRHVEELDDVAQFAIQQVFYMKSKNVKIKTTIGAGLDITQFKQALSMLVAGAPGLLVHYFEGLHPEHLFKSFDTDRDDVLSSDEFSQGIALLCVGSLQEIITFSLQDLMIQRGQPHLSRDDTTTRLETLFYSQIKNRHNLKSTNQLDIAKLIATKFSCQLVADATIFITAKLNHAVTKFNHSDLREWIQKSVLISPIEEQLALEPKDLAKQLNIVCNIPLSSSSSSTCFTIEEIRDQKKKFPVFPILVCSNGSRLLFATELHQAVVNGEIEKVEEILKNNPDHDRNPLDLCQRTPADYAVLTVHYEIVRVLVEYSCKVPGMAVMQELIEQLPTRMTSEERVQMDKKISNLCVLLLSFGMAVNSLSSFSLLSPSPSSSSSSSSSFSTSSSSATSSSSSSSPAHSTLPSLPHSFSTVGQTPSGMARLAIPQSVSCSDISSESMTPRSRATVSSSSLDTPRTKAQNATNAVLSSPSGSFIFHAACCKQLWTVFELLMTAGQPSTELLNLLDLEGKAPIHYASLSGSNSAIRLLHQHHVDLNLRTLDGNTSIHLAIINRQINSLKLLISLKADPTLKDLSLKTPIALAHDLHIGAEAEEILERATRAFMLERFQKN